MNDGHDNQVQIAILLAEREKRRAFEAAIAGPEEQARLEETLGRPIPAGDPNDPPGTIDHGQLQITHIYDTGTVEGGFRDGTDYQEIYRYSGIIPPGDDGEPDITRTIPVCHATNDTLRAELRMRYGEKMTGLKTPLSSAAKILRRDAEEIADRIYAEFGCDAGCGMPGIVQIVEEVLGRFPSRTDCYRAASDCEGKLWTDILPRAPTQALVDETAGRTRTPEQYAALAPAGERARMQETEKTLAYMTQDLSSYAAALEQKTKRIAELEGLLTASQTALADRAPDALRLLELNGAAIYRFRPTDEQSRANLLAWLDECRWPGVVTLTVIQEEPPHRQTCPANRHPEDALDLCHCLARDPDGALTVPGGPHCPATGPAPRPEPEQIKHNCPCEYLPVEEPTPTPMQDVAAMMAPTIVQLEDRLHRIEEGRDQVSETLISHANGRIIDLERFAEKTHDRLARLEQRPIPCPPTEDQIRVVIRDEISRYPDELQAVIRQEIGPKPAIPLSDRVRGHEMQREVDMQTLSTVLTEHRCRIEHLEKLERVPTPLEPIQARWSDEQVVGMQQSIATLEAEIRAGRDDPLTLEQEQRVRAILRDEIRDSPHVVPADEAGRIARHIAQQEIHIALKRAATNARPASHRTVVVKERNP